VPLPIEMTINRGYSAVFKVCKAYFVRNSICNILAYVVEVYLHHNQVSQLEGKCKKKSLLSAAIPIVSHAVAHQLISNQCIQTTVTQRSTNTDSMRSLIKQALDERIS